MSGALDRTGEFRACTQSFHDKLLSGRLRLKPPHHKNLHSVDTRHTADLLAKSKQMSTELKMTVSKMTKLKLLFQDASNSSPEVLSKLIEVIQYDIMDLNKAKFQLKASLSEVKEHSVTSVQHLKHIDLIVIGLECYLSSLVSEFRALLEKHKAYLSADSKKSDVDTRLNCNPNQLTKSASLSGISIPNLQSSINPTSNAYMSTAHSVKEHLQVNNHQHSNGLFNSTLSSIAHVSSSYSSNLPTVTPIAVLNGAPTVSRSEFYNSSQSGTTHQAVEQLQLFDSNQHVPLIDQEVRQRDAAIRRVEQLSFNSERFTNNFLVWYRNKMI
uniref:Uncharacterized protein n=1 Tax=Schistosoma japonicum TaxID=6182 RepID=C1L3S4_SCHJA|nr:hypothetical protein [Schistosoma japonicum]